ncbi:MAG: hypothetical protein ACI8SJ_002790, partial [Shewanella sp.]
SRLSLDFVANNHIHPTVMFFVRLLFSITRED